MGKLHKVARGKRKEIAHMMNWERRGLSSME